MKGLPRIYQTFLRTAAAEMLQYRMAMLIWYLHIVLEPVIYLIVWATVARAQGGSVGGMTPEDFAGYYLIMMVVNHATFTWVMWEFGHRVISGSLSMSLLRPLHPIHDDIAYNLANKMMTMIVMIPVVIILTIAFRPRIHPEPWAILTFIPALAISYLLRFFIEWTIALSAFWTTRSDAVNESYYGVLIFAGGRVAPMELLPGPLVILANMLPFRWMLSFPVELLQGRLSPREAAIGLCIQCAWLLAAFGLLNLVWRQGLKRYSAVGS